MGSCYFYAVSDFLLFFDNYVEILTNFFYN